MKSKSKPFINRFMAVVLSVCMIMSSGFLITWTVNASEYEIIGNTNESYEKLSLVNHISDYIYFDNGETKWDEVYAYWWNINYERTYDIDGNDWGIEKTIDNETGKETWKPVEYPGTKLTRIEDTDIWQIKIPFNANCIIFNNGISDNQVQTGETSYSTIDLKLDTKNNAGQIYVIDTTPKSEKNVQYKNPVSGRGIFKTRLTYKMGKWVNYDSTYLTIQNPEKDDSYEYEVNEDNTITITSYFGDSKSISIPSIIDNKKVTSISDCAFYNCKNLVSVTIPDSITQINACAFYCCYNLKNINIASSVTLIGDKAFVGCINLTTITIPDSVISIGESAFWCCKSLTDVIIGKNVVSIGDYAFFGCTNLKRVSIPNSVTSIGKSAFVYYDNNHITMIDDPYSGDKLDQLMILGTEGSYAEIYAKEHNIPFNYYKPSSVNPDAYHFYYSSDVINLGDKFVVGADKLGGNYTGMYYSGPGKVEWEISNRNVIDFIPIHDSKTGKDILYYDDTTQLHLEAKNFGESRLTMKLDGKPVCSETIKIQLTGDMLATDYKSHIMDAPSMTKIKSAVDITRDVIGELSSWDIMWISQYSVMDSNLLGTELTLGYIYNYISTGEYYSRNDDEVLYSLLMNYYGIDRSDISSYENQYKAIYNFIGAIHSEEDFVNNMKNITSFTYKDISSIIGDLKGIGIFDALGYIVDTSISIYDVATTILLLEQFDLNTVKELKSYVCAVGNTGTPMYKAIERLEKHILDLDDFRNEEFKKILVEQCVNIIADVLANTVVVEGIPVLSIANSIRSYVASIYKLKGGLMVDDLNNVTIAFDYSKIMFEYINTANRLENIRDCFDFYKAAMLTLLDYTDVIIIAVLIWIIFA